MPRGEFCGCGDRGRTVMILFPFRFFLDSTTALGDPGQYSLPVNFYYVTVERSLESSAGLQRSPLFWSWDPRLFWHRWFIAR